ncbi:cytochrome P450 [Thozetella sp. PMI_491]|nr:cytochrome P450 [Thozetella sp. PMI_491]
MFAEIFSYAGIASVSILAAVGIAGAAGIVYWLLGCIYNLTLHPLARFPGPLLYRATRLATVNRMLRGDLYSDLLRLHKKYGDVVRIAPNELAFAHENAWKEIYGHRPNGGDGPEEIPKWTKFYANTGMPPSIVSEDIKGHALLRRLLAPGFSEKTMRGQEPIIGSYIDLLMHQLHKQCVVRQIDTMDENGKKKANLQVGAPKSLDLTNWYNWTAFDVIGDLTFGEPFGCLERGAYDPFVGQLNITGTVAAIISAAKYMGLEPIVFPVLRFFIIKRRPMQVEMADKLRKRMALKEERPDLIGGLIRKKETMNWDFARVRINAGVLCVAGSETTATLLCGVTFLLLKHPDILDRLKQEVRSTFKSEDEITLTSVSKLEYMLACLNEALRAYPPAPVGFPREVPKGGVMINGQFIPEGTLVAAWQWAIYHNEKNFVDPFGFRPERFMNDPRFANDKFDMLQPFSFGPRNCIGRHLAYAEMRLILARLIYNFDPQLVDEKKNWLDQEVYVLWRKPSLNVFLKPVSREQGEKATVK